MPGAPSLGSAPAFYLTNLKNLKKSTIKHTDLTSNQIEPGMYAS
jgi:hypothetical protein